MSHASDATALPRDQNTCFHSWCKGQFCAVADLGERFHQGILSSEGDGGERFGVELVCSDFADSTTTGPQIDFTFTAIAETGVVQHSVRISPEAALRHAAAIARAASIALASR
jgi:hypothetical protein